MRAPLLTTGVVNVSNEGEANRSLGGNDAKHSCTRRNITLGGHAATR